MTDISTITPEKRAEIKAKLAEFDARIAANKEEARPFRDQLEPIIRRGAAIDEERALYLEEHRVEIAGTCESCGKLLFAGEHGSMPYEDEGFMYCADHSMTYGEIQNYWTRESDTQGDPDQEESKAAALEMVASHVAAGGSLDDRITYVLEASL